MYCRPTRIFPSVCNARDSTLGGTRLGPPPAAGGFISTGLNTRPCLKVWSQLPSALRRASPRRAHPAKDSNSPPTSVLPSGCVSTTFTCLDLLCVAVALKVEATAPIEKIGVGVAMGDGVGEGVGVG